MLGDDDKTPTIKNTDNEKCVWCGRPTEPLFHGNKMRWCPYCEKDKAKYIRFAKISLESSPEAYICLIKK